MLDVRRNPQVRKLWWRNPELPEVVTTIRRSRRARMSDPEELIHVPVKARGHFGEVGRFAPSDKWRPYSRLGVDHGYIVPLYALREIRERYRLSQATTAYWRKHVLPDPIDVVLRRGIRSHHWSKLQLLALDDVLLYLERHRFLQLNVFFDDAITLFHEGCEFLEQYYADKYDNLPLVEYDKFGVRTLNDN